ENLLVGAKGGGGWSVERVYQYFPKLGQLAGRRGGSLSGGEQQMLTVARTLMGNPRILLLDEPSEGLAPVIVQALGQQIAALKRDARSGAGAHSGSAEKTQARGAGGPPRTNYEERAEPRGEGRGAPPRGPAPPRRPSLPI